MPKTRIYELAKQIDVSNKDIIDKLQTYGITVNNQLSSLEDSDVRRLISDLKKPKRIAKPEGPSERVPKTLPQAERTETPATGTSRPDGQRPEGAARPEGTPRPDGQRPMRPRPEGAPRPDSQRPMRPRPEGASRPEGVPRPDGQRPMRPRPEGAARPEGAPRPDGQRPMRPRPEGAPRPEGQRPEGAPRPMRPRPDGAQRPEGQRPEGAPRPDGQRPMRPRPDGEPRPEGSPRPDGQRPMRPRPDGQRPMRPRPDGALRPDGQRPMRPRPDGSPRPEGAPRPDGQRPDGQRPMRPRPDGQYPDGQRPMRPRPEGAPRPDGDEVVVRTDHQPLPSEASLPKAEVQPMDIQPPKPEAPPKAEVQPSKVETSLPKAETPPSAPTPTEAPPRLENVAPKPESQAPHVDEKPSNTEHQPPRPQPESIDKSESRPSAPSADNAVNTEVRQNRPDNRPPHTDRPRNDNRTDRPRSDGQRPGGGYSKGTSKPYTGGSGTGSGTGGPRQGGSRPYSGTGTGTGTGPNSRPASGSRPASDGRPAMGNRPSTGYNKPDAGSRPAGARFGTGARPGQGGAPQGGGAHPGGPRPGGFKPGFPKKDEGRPGFAKPGGRPAFGKKDDKKVAEPSKDDRKQDWKKNEQMRTVKSKDNKDATDKKENKQFLDRADGRGKKGQGKSKGTALKREMPKVVEPVITMITVHTEITVRDLAEKLHKSNADIIKILMKKGIMATANQTIDYDTAVYVAESMNVLVQEYVEVDVFEEAFAEKPDDENNLVDRPPVVVVMGHVDHGKTSLLDVIRDASVQQTEAGGITQHIGAYTVNINDKPITFLDTPGHEAFTAMRMRGAQVTDIAVLVVAADDGVMPQTVEAINHAKAAGVDIIVAINKIDKPGANPDRVKQELTEHGLLVEDWGGETIAVPVSALKKTGIEHLLEMIIIVSEMKELRANPYKPARGSIIEAKLDKGRGPVATVLVQDGTLHVGDPIVAGPCFGKIRAMTDDKGRNVKEAGPSIPVEVIGLSEVPLAGDMFYVAEHEKQARQLSETVIAKGRESMIKISHSKVSLDDLFNQIQAGNVKDLNVVVKADVQGSVEALKTSLDKLSNDQVRVRTIHGGVGAITETDVMLASASNAIIIGFNVRPEPMAKSVADAEKVDVRLYRVIYSAIDDITAAMKGMLDPEFREKVLGHAEIRQLFRASGIGTIGGSYVTDGKITRSAKVRIVRDGRVVYDGTLDTLKRFKDDAREVASGYECGMLFNKFNDIKENDKVEAYIMEEIPR